MYVTSKYGSRRLLQEYLLFTFQWQTRARCLFLKCYQNIICMKGVISFLFMSLVLKILCNSPPEITGYSTATVVAYTKLSTCLWDQSTSPPTTLRSSSLTLERMLLVVFPLSPAIYTDLLECCRSSDTGGQGGRGESGTILMGVWFLMLLLRKISIE